MTFVLWETERISSISRRKRGFPQGFCFCADHVPTRELLSCFRPLVAHGETRKHFVDLPIEAIAATRLAHPHGSDRSRNDIYFARTDCPDLELSSELNQDRSCRRDLSRAKIGEPDTLTTSATSSLSVCQYVGSGRRPSRASEVSG
jgi:hypothetical protein